MELSLRMHGMTAATYIHIYCNNNNHNSWLTYIEGLLHIVGRTFLNTFMCFVYILIATHDVGSKMIPTGPIMKWMLMLSKF